jgi:hypothetical protein
MDRRSAIKVMGLGGVGAMFCDIPGTSSASPGEYVADLNFSESTFTGTITEPDGTVNNLSGYHGEGTLPPLGGQPCATSDADVVLSGQLDYPQGFTVPAGQVWEFDPTTSTTITTGGNIIVEGTLRAAPPAAGVTHRIRFVGINEANIVGGHTHVPLASDVGLWVHGGLLDISGTPKKAWNRTGSDPSWLPTDQLLHCPTTPGQYTAVPYAGTVTSASSITRNTVQHVHFGEVVNMTRDFVIEAVGGRAHIMFIHVTRPQRLSYVELVNLGPAGKLGRYPLHVHMNDDGSVGSKFVGNVAKNCGNHAFVPHTSHGCDFTESIAYRTIDDAFWWDETERTERTTWDRCGAIETIDGSGFRLLAGRGNSVVEAFAFGTNSNDSHGGFLWPSSTNNDRSLWHSEGIVAHNNRASGVRVWHNSPTLHTINGAVSYNNLSAGFSHGAYNNVYRYQYCVAFGNIQTDFDALALGGWVVKDCWFERIHLGHHNVTGPGTTNTLTASELWPLGTVDISESGFPGVFLFKATHRLADMKLADFTVTGTQLSTVIVDNFKAADFTLAP